jgi:hypothetical protein
MTFVLLLMCDDFFFNNVVTTRMFGHKQAKRCKGIEKAKKAT